MVALPSNPYPITGPKNKERKMVYYISDLHFGHRNVIGMDGRPFETIEEMDETLIWLWMN